MRFLFTYLLLMVCVPGRAATMCAQIPVDDMYSGLVDSIAVNVVRSVDWGLFYENGLTIGGVAACASRNNNVDWENRVTERIVYNSEADSNYACFCKVTKPAVSSWYLVDSFMDESGCMAGCAEKCELGVLDDPEFWSALLLTMQN